MKPDRERDGNQTACQSRACACYRLFKRILLTRLLLNKARHTLYMYAPLFVILLLLVILFTKNTIQFIKSIELYILLESKINCTIVYFSKLYNIFCEVKSNYISTHVQLIV